ncbi:MAG: energy transducer TonB [Rhodocyclaceae bacterium]|nr:energy transducer TonB [Rhodocyclaceae bacterium]
MHAGVVPRQKAMDVLQAFLIVPQRIAPRIVPPAPPQPERMVQRAPKQAEALPPLSTTAAAPTAMVAPPVAPVEAKPAPCGGAGRGSRAAARRGAPFRCRLPGQPEPAYPVSSRRRGEEGRVMLRVFVDAQGRAAKVEVQESSGHNRLDESAVTAVARWRFVPARRGSEPLAAWVRVPIVFSLRD